MKDRADKSMEIVTGTTETLARIKPTDPLRLVKREVHKKLKKRNFSDSSGNSPDKILSDAAQDGTCPARAIVPSGHGTMARAMKKN